MIRYLYLCLFILGVFLFTNGCNSVMSKEECKNADWYIRGVSDGQRFTSTNLEPLVEACESSYPVNKNEYEKGRLDGIKYKCEIADWFVIGKDDGYNFKQPSFGKYKYYCSKTPTPVNEPEYYKGLKQGRNSKCSEVNWESMGYSEGLNFKKNSRVNYFKENCSGTDYTFNNVLYNQGLTRAANQVCTSDKGYSNGYSLQFDFQGLCKLSSNAQSYYLSEFLGANNRIIADEKDKLQKEIERYKEVSKKVPTQNLYKMLEQNYIILVNALDKYEKLYYGYNSRAVRTGEKAIQIYDNIIEKLPYPKIIETIKSANEMISDYNSTMQFIGLEIDSLKVNLDAYYRGMNLAISTGDEFMYSLSKHNADMTINKINCRINNANYISKDFQNTLNNLTGREGSFVKRFSKTCY